MTSNFSYEYRLDALMPRVIVKNEIEDFKFNAETCGISDDLIKLYANLNTKEKETVLEEVSEELKSCFNDSFAFYTKVFSNKLKEKSSNIMDTSNLSLLRFMSLIEDLDFLTYYGDISYNEDKATLLLLKDWKIFGESLKLKLKRVFEEVGDVPLGFEVDGFWQALSQNRIKFVQSEIDTRVELQLV